MKHYIYSLLLAIGSLCVEDNEAELNPEAVPACESIGII